MLKRYSNWGQQMQALGEFLPVWFPRLREVTPLDANNFVRQGAPPPLAEFYAMIGGRVDILSVQNHFEEPVRIHEEEGKLIFYLENQHVYEWATKAAEEDPPVFIRETGTRPWQEESEMLSGFLCQAVIFEAIMGAPYDAFFGCLPSEVLDPILPHLKPLPFDPWLWPGEGTHFYRAGDALAFVTQNTPNRVDFACGARQPHDLDFLRPYVTDDWACDPTKP